jgi:hypothetical protein
MSDEQAPSSSLESLQDELWRVWGTVNKLAIDSPLSPNDLSDEGKSLLEAAIVGKRITEVEVAIFLHGLKQAFDLYITDWKKEKLFWACQIFLKPDGSLVAKSDAIEFRNLLKKYCDEHSLNLSDLEAEYLKKVTSLPFFPVYEWLFVKEAQFKNSPNFPVANDVQPLEEETTPESSFKPEEEKQGFLRNFFKDSVSGITTVAFILGIVALHAGAKSCVRSNYKEEAARKQYESSQRETDEVRSRIRSEAQRRQEQGRQQDQVGDSQNPRGAGSKLTPEQIKIMEAELRRADTERGKR